MPVCSRSSFYLGIVNRQAIWTDVARMAFFDKSFQYLRAARIVDLVIPYKQIKVIDILSPVAFARNLLKDSTIFLGDDIHKTISPKFPSSRQFKYLKLVQRFIKRNFKLDCIGDFAF